MVFIAVLLAIPLFWIPSLLDHGASEVVSQLLGIWALIAMTIGQVLATRFRLIEGLFGGLDQVYVLHKWLGIAALLVTIPINCAAPLLSAKK